MLPGAHPENCRPESSLDRGERWNGISGGEVGDDNAPAGADALAHARELMQKILEIDSSAPTKELFRVHLERTGHPELLERIDAAPALQHGSPPNMN
jgi:hypothetical protein